MKKQLSALGLGVIAFAAMSSVDTNALEKLVVTADALNIRSGPGTTYEKIGLLYKGSRVTKNEEKNGWLKITTSNGKTGWVSKQYISNSSNSVSTGTSTGTTAYVSVSTSLNLRSGDSTSSSVIGKLSNNTKVEVIKKKDNGWSYIKTSDGKVGWVNSSYLKSSLGGSSSNGNASSGSSTSSGIVVTASSLNMRTGPGTDSSVIKSLSKGTDVSIIEKSGSWVKVKLSDGTTGWVSEKYISSSNDSNSSTSESTSGRLKINVSSALNVRKGPGLNYSVITSVPGGSVVESLEKASGWYKIKLSNGTTGWVSGDYVSSTNDDLTNSSGGSNSSGNTGNIGSGQSSQKGESVVNYAYKLIGTPYKWGGNGPDNFDCSGFTQWVYKYSVGVSIPRVSRDQANAGTPVSKGDYRPGDLLYFNTSGDGSSTVNHVGIYIGGDSFIHCSGTQSNPGNVKVSSLSGFYGNALLGARRLV